MPYIKKEMRERIEWLDQIVDLAKRLETEGDLNYTITRLCHEYLKIKGEKYATYNSIIGALECAKLELYRRKIAGYENFKARENGDVI